MATAAVLLYPTHGHICPALPVVAELCRRGERAVFHGTERSRSRIEATGAGFRRYAARHDDFNPTPPTAGLLHDMSRLGALTERLLPGLLEAVAADAPDYLLVDTKSLWGRLVGQILGLPTVTLSVVFAIRPGLVPVQSLVAMLYGGASREGLVDGMVELGRYYDVCRRIDAVHHLRSPGIIEYLGNPQALNIVFTSRAFQLQGDRFGPEYLFVGASLPESPPGAPPQPLPFEVGDRPSVYISLGTTFNQDPAFYRACFEAFADQPVLVVLSTGGAPTEPLGPPPANFVVRPFVPQLQVLERAALFVTHGGMNSANEALALGVPMVVVPQRGDQYLVGARLTELGAGLCLPPPVTGLYPAARRVLEEPGFRARARALGETVRDGGGSRRAAEAILQFAATPRSS